TDSGSAQASVAERPVALPPVIYQGGVTSMPPLSFTCPKTNQQAPTGIETDVQSMSAFWKAMLKMNCTNCVEHRNTSMSAMTTNGTVEDDMGQYRSKAYRNTSPSCWR